MPVHQAALRAVLEALVKALTPTTGAVDSSSSKPEARSRGGGDGSATSGSGGDADAVGMLTAAADEASRRLLDWAKVSARPAALCR